MTDIKQEVFPDYELDIIDISVIYPGAGPVEVEEGIVMAIEEKVRLLENVERVTSSASEGKALISIELLKGEDSSKTLQEVKNAVDRIASMPEESERPLISLKSRKREVVRLAVYGDIDERSLYYFAWNIREELLTRPEISQIEFRGVRKPEISVEVSQSILRTYGLTLEEIAGAIRKNAVDVPAGGVKAESGEVLLRSAGRRDFAGEFKDITLVSSRDGTEVTLDHIAKMTDGFEDSYREAYFNGKRAVLINVFRTGDETPTGISESVNRYIDEMSQTLPEGIEINAYYDRSDIYRARIELLLKNGGIGLILVLMALGLFLEARLAFWVAMGIPISIIGAFVILPLFGGSINLVSLFAFIVTLGIIVDDAVIIGENIYYHRQKGLDSLQAAIKGAVELAPSVTFAVMTNIIAFIPLLFVPGSTGKFFSILPAVIIAVFLISLGECLFILPSHLSYKKKTIENSRFQQILNGLPNLCANGMDRFTASFFTPLLRRLILLRYHVLLVSMALLVIVYAYWDRGWINFSFKPRIQTDRIDVEIVLPFGAPIEEVREKACLIEEGGLRALKRTGEEGIVTGVLRDIGRRGPNTAEVSFHLVSSDKRIVGARQFSSLWREEVDAVTGLESLFFDYLIGLGGSAAIDIELSHPDPDMLEAAAGDLASELRQYQGVTDIDDGFAKGKLRFDFEISPQGESLGLKSEDIGKKIRHSFYGAEALRQQRGRDEIKVMVRLPENERKSLFYLEEMLISTGDGGEIPLAAAAEIKKSRAYTEIRRVDGKRVIDVTANVLPGITNENKVLSSLKKGYLDELSGRYQGLKYSFEGRQRDQKKALKQLFKGLLFALAGIFCLLAILFRSYVQAFLVMLSVLFGLAGALAGHVIMGYNLSIISIFGMMALCGVVINGGLVLTVTYNAFCEQGATCSEAALMAGVRRFRPIVLTAVTTFLGLAPMIFEKSVQARFLIPMALSLGYGILFTTLFILVLVPVFLMISNDIRCRFGEGKC